MLQENQIKQGDSERLQFILPKDFHDTNCRCQFTQGTPIPFMLLVFYLSSHDTILVTIQKSDVSTFQ
jgi:hypothetical protein